MGEEKINVNGNRFAGVMKKRTFAELIEIVKKKRNDYEPEAVEAAEAELEYRISIGEKWEAPQKETEIKLTAKEKAEMPLPLEYKILTLIFPVVIGTFSKARKLSDEGYKKQSVELQKWFLFGLLFYVGILVALFIFSQITG